MLTVDVVPLSRNPVIPIRHFGDLPHKVMHAAWRVCFICLLAAFGYGRCCFGDNVLYDFESDAAQWRLAESQSGPDPTLSDDCSTSGKTSLKLIASFPGEVEVVTKPRSDWSWLDTLSFDVFLAADAPEDMQMLIIIRDRDLLWYQAMPTTPLKPGAWSNIQIDISPSAREWKFQGHFKPWDGYVTQNVKSFSIRFFSKENYEGPIYIDSINGKARDCPHSDTRRLIEFQVNSDEVGLYEKFETTFMLDKTYSNPFDPEVVDIKGVFVSPSGKIVSVPAFFYQHHLRRLVGQKEVLIPVGKPKWKIRYTPTEIGKHFYRIEIRDTHETSTEERTFNVVLPKGNEKPRGFARVSKQDWRYFEFDNGEFFFPIGHNVHAPYNFMYGSLYDRIPDKETSIKKGMGTYIYDRIFNKMAENDENFVEVWMCAWGMAIEWNQNHNFFHGLGWYNLQNAWKLDYILELAEKKGLYVNLVLMNHGQLSTWIDQEWEDNPYSVKLGGPLQSPEEFFTNDEAMAYFKKRMRYIIARWGYSTHLFSMELMSELDLVGDSFGFHDSPVKTEWHKTLTPFFKAADPWNHLLTSHYSSGWWREDPKVLRVPMISFTTTDGYRAWGSRDKSVVEIAHETAIHNAEFKKPTMITEYGGENKIEADKIFEADLHCGIWGSYMTTCAGTPLFWWLHFVEDNDLYHHFKALAAFDKGFDRRGKSLESYDSEESDVINIKGGTGKLRAQCLKDSNIVLAWIYQYNTLVGAPVKPITGASMDIQGLAKGKYKVEFWDTYKGLIRERRQIQVADAGATIDLPVVEKDMACKINRVQESEKTGK